MKDDFLWDGSGEPDADIVALEEALRPLRHEPVPFLPPARRRVWPVVVVALAAAALVATLLWPRGLPALDVGGVATSGTVALDTIGTVAVGPDTVLRRVAGDGVQLELDAGTVDVDVVAPPRTLVIHTPLGDVVDLGCRYRLAVVGDMGDLTVGHGIVAVEHPVRTVFVPAGATVALTDTGPETPWFLDAPADLADALRTEDTNALLAALPSARPRDTLSLVHLLEVLPPDARAAVYDRIDALVPGDPTWREPALRADPATLGLLLDHVAPSWEVSR